MVNLIGQHIESIGDIEATDVTWSIHVEGGYLGMLNSFAEGALSAPIPVGESVQINSKFLLGFGEVDITISAASPISNIAEINTKGFIFGPLILIST